MKTLPTKRYDTLVIKRTIAMPGRGGGRHTSVSLEDAFWFELKHIAFKRGMGVAELVKYIDAERVDGSLSGCIRLFVLDHYRNGGK